MLALLLVNGCAALQGGYVTSNYGDLPRGSLISYGPDEAAEFAVHAQQVVAQMRAQAAQGRIYSESGLIPLAALIAFEGFRRGSGIGIAAMAAGGGAVYGVREYVLAPRYERIYSRAEAAIQCARTTYAVATAPALERRLALASGEAAQHALTSASDALGKTKTILLRLGVDDNLQSTASAEEWLDDLYAQKSQWDAYIEAPLSQQNALLFKAVHLIIAQTNQQIADDQPTIQEDRSLIGGAFKVSGVQPAGRQPQNAPPSITVPEKLASALAAASAPATASHFEQQRETANEALLAADTAVRLYIATAKKITSSSTTYGPADYSGCAYQQLTGTRPAIAPPMELGVNDADSNTTKTTVVGRTVSVTISGGTAPIVASLLDEPQKDQSGAALPVPQPRVESLSTGPVVRVDIPIGTPDESYTVIVKDAAGTLKQFVVRVGKAPAGSATTQAGDPAQAQLLPQRERKVSPVPQPPATARDDENSAPLKEQQAVLHARAGQLPVKLDGLKAAAFVGLLPTGDLYFEAVYDLDADGSIYWKQDRYGQPGTSLSTHDGHYLDANAVAYIALSERVMSHTKSSLGDVAAVIYGDTVAFAVVGDVAPNSKLGEGSLALFRAIGIERIDNEGKFRNASTPRTVATVVFAGSASEVDTSSQAQLMASVQQTGLKRWQALLASTLGR
ncbi:glycoside hydrolase family 75 protein [Trinickia sp. NRRL B-1857]|uniref:glycoside hydrolase family 75 protein n=1 Tax=Trinickia sp. NRRL B-1857 TaxID=3162879 RepID=UPI003D2A20B2